MSQNTNNLAAYIWSLADLLRGDFKQSQYGRIILPFTLLRRLECVLEASKESVLKQVPIVEQMKLPEEAQEKLLLRATGGLSFFNTSPMDLATLGEAGIKANLERYIQCFSRDAREIFDHFKFAIFGLLHAPAPCFTEDRPTPIDLAQDGVAAAPRTWQLANVRASLSQQ